MCIKGVIVIWIKQKDIFQPAETANVGWNREISQKKMCKISPHAGVKLHILFSFFQLEAQAKS